MIAWKGVVGDPPSPEAEQDTRPRVVRAALRAPGGRFREPVALRTVRARDEAELGSALAAAGPGGRAEVVWEEDRDGARLFGAYAGPRDDFGARSAVSRAQGGQLYQPVLAFAPDGTLAAAWGWYAGAQRSGLQAARAVAGDVGTTTTVSDAVPLDWGIADVMAPRLSIDAHGTATAYWRQQYPVTEGSTTSYNTARIQTATGTPTP